MLSNIRSIHFIGICGTAMASVAAALRERGVRITGSDANVYPPMSTFLAARGIKVREGYREENLIDAPDLVATPSVAAIPRLRRCWNASCFIVLCLNC